MLRVAVALYLLASVLACHEARPIGGLELLLRLVLAVLVLMKAPWLSFGAMAAAAALVAWHWSGREGRHPA